MAEPTEVPDLFGRQTELVHAVTCRIHGGIPMSKWDWYALMGLFHLLGMEIVEPDEPAEPEPVGDEADGG